MEKYMISIAQLSAPRIEAHGILWTVAVVIVHCATREYWGDGSEPVPLWHGGDPHGIAKNCVGKGTRQRAADT